MTTSDYRDLIDGVAMWRVSLLGATTSHEQRIAAATLRRWADELRAAACPRASAYDRERAGKVLAACGELLAEKQAMFQAADAALCRTAFAGEYR